MFLFANYHWMKQESDADGAFSLPANSYDLAAEWGPVTGMPRHNFSAMFSSSLTRSLRVSLGAAWASALAGVVALALLLRGTLRLSERRGAFVSAVTHELRTPLTTFRMYSEMLAEGMVSDETSRKRYLETLRSEADRLGHLVENVLSYARLERGRGAKAKEKVALTPLLERATSRVADRATQSGKTLSLEIDKGIKSDLVNTDPGAVEQIVMNLIDFGMNVQAAGDAPRVMHSGSATPTGLPAEGSGTVSVEAGVSDEVVEKLKAKGHKVVRARGYGGYQGILIDWESGVLHGGTESRKDGTAVGY